MPERSSQEIAAALAATAEQIRREEDRPRPLGSTPTSVGGNKLTWFNVQSDSTIPTWSSAAGWQTVTACHRAVRGGADADTVDTNIQVFNQLYSRRAKIDTGTNCNVGCVKDSAGDWIAVEYAWGVHYKD